VKTIAGSLLVAGLALAAGRAGAADEPALGKEVDVATVVRIALERNPDVLEASDRVEAADARARAAGRWPDLGVQAQLWQQPLSKPVDFSQANMIMAGIRQGFPAPGAAAWREEAGVAEATSARAGALGRRAEVVQEVRRAFAQYWLSEQEQLIHLEHMDLTDQIVQESRSYVAQGQMTNVDFLRTTVELARVHAVLATVAQQRRASGARLNTLMAREPDAALGTPRAMSLPELEQSVADLEARSEEKPEVVAARAGVTRAEAQLSAVRAESTWPEFMIGLDYGYMPMDGSSTYTAMVGFTLPWLAPRHADQRREASASVAAAQRALSSARNSSRYQLRDALARYRAARDTSDLVERELLPQAHMAAGAAQDAFRSGRAESLGLLDSLRQLLDVRLEAARSRARVEEAWADVERASGRDPAGAREGKP
jgi:cobalt-zinc-cadmium efflux system outer membrane protein